MMLKLGISTLQNDDLTRKYGKLKGVLATFREFMAIYDMSYLDPTSKI
jgi:hypothetical protein